MPELVDVRGLSIELPIAGSRFVKVVEGIDLQVGDGEVVGLAGESGSGKTLSVLALAHLLPPGARVAAESLTVAGVDVLAADEDALCALRGGTLGYLFQEPAQALNPVRAVWYQVSEAVRLRRDLSRSQARDLAEGLLAEVGLDNAPEIARAYPHQLSGGQRQRVLLAAALAGEPRLLVADEPTSALDPVAQRHLVELLVGLCRRRRLALLFVSHDLALIEAIADRVTVAYAGETVETGSRNQVFKEAAHPYTRALLESLPGRASAMPPPFPTIQGAPPRAGEWHQGCRFAPRCPLVFERCRRSHPPLTGVTTRLVRCFLHETESRGAP